jgi:tRNA(Ile)-lysidine synthase
MASGLARQVLDSIRQRGLLRAGDRVGAAVSGGADSVALLRLLLELRAELGIVLAVVHYHHGIRGAEADSDAALVAALAAEHKLELHTASGDAPGHARARGLSLEAAARELRYTFFRDLLRAGALTRIATGHTLDDQAETVLLRLIRGTGMRGLAGIHPLRREEGPGEAAIVRPLLGVRRREVEDYLRGLGQAWREDASNLDLSHTRNRVRHRLLPLLESEFNPAIVQTLAETAEIARAEEYDWQREVERAADKVLVAAEAGQAALRLEPLLGHPLAMQRRCCAWRRRALPPPMSCPAAGWRGAAQAGCCWPAKRPGGNQCVVGGVKAKRDRTRRRAARPMSIPCPCPGRCWCRGWGR